MTSIFVYHLNVIDIEIDRYSGMVINIEKKNKRLALIDFIYILKFNQKFV